MLGRRVAPAPILISSNVKKKALLQFMFSTYTQITICLTHRMSQRGRINITRQSMYHNRPTSHFTQVLLGTDLSLGMTY